MTINETVLSGCSVPTDADPLDVPKFVGVDEHRVELGRGVHLGQRQFQLARTEIITLIGCIVPYHEHPEYDTGSYSPRSQTIYHFRFMTLVDSNTYGHTKDHPGDDVLKNSHPREFAPHPDLDGVVARGFYPNDLALLLAGQPDLERGHALLDPVDDYRGACGGGCDGNSLRLSPRQRRAAGRKQHARESQDEKPSCVLSPHGCLAFAYECIRGQKKSCQGCVNFLDEAGRGRVAGTPRRKEDAGKAGNWAL